MTKNLVESNYPAADPIVFTVEDAMRLRPMRSTFRRPVLVPCGGSKVAADAHSNLRTHLGVVQHTDYGGSLWENYGIENSPYHSGQKLWVREAWFCNQFGYGKYKEGESAKVQEDAWRKATVYRSDGEFHSHFPEDEEDARWSPPQHMPRWASKWGTMVVLSVSMQQVQSMTESDASREGFLAITRDCKVPKIAKEWDRAYGRVAQWATNPWAWVVEFDLFARTS